MNNPIHKSFESLDVQLLENVKIMTRPDEVPE
jgi:hypothetical protein